MTASRLLEGRVALITGASRGIGAAVAKRFAAEGAHVVLIARTVGGLEEVDDAIQAAGGSATLVPCDLGDFERLDTLGPHLLERFGKLDIFVGNAALLGTLTPLVQYDATSWQQLFDINVHANWRLIRVVDPLLRLSDSGRGILVTSGVGSHPRAYWGAYAVTKAAVDAMARLWAAELVKTPVRVNLLNPGGTATRMRAEAFPGEDPASLKTPEQVAQSFLELASPACTRHGELVNA